MHSFHSGSTTVHYNSDGSGEAIVLRNDGNGQQELRVPCQDLVAFVAELVRSDLISKLEQADPDDLLLGLWQRR